VTSSPALWLSCRQLCLLRRLLRLLRVLVPRGSACAAMATSDEQPLSFHTVLFPSRPPVVFRRPNSDDDDDDDDDDDMLDSDRAGLLPTIRPHVRRDSRRQAQSPPAAATLPSSSSTTSTSTSAPLQSSSAAAAAATAAAVTIDSPAAVESAGPALLPAAVRICIHRHPLLTVAGVIVAIVGVALLAAAVPLITSTGVPEPAAANAADQADPSSAWPTWSVDAIAAAADLARWSSPRAVRILHLSDVHLDPLFDPGTPTALFCRPDPRFANLPRPSSPAPFGRRGCDAPAALVRAAAAALGSAARLDHGLAPQFGIITGDFVAHDLDRSFSDDTGLRAALLTTVQQTVGMLMARAPAGFPLIPVIGNNDMPHDYVLPNPVADGWYGALWATLAPLLQCGGDSVCINGTLASAGASFAAGGYFAWPLPQHGMVVLSMNTVVFSPKTSNVGDVASAQLDWMDERMSNACAQGQRVLIAGHIPPVYVCVCVCLCVCVCVCMLVNTHSAFLLSLPASSSVDLSSSPSRLLSISVSLLLDLCLSASVDLCLSAP
jgi:hypothetical protein